jgi:hypothetical protein
MNKLILFALMAVLFTACQKPVDQTVSVPTLKKATLCVTLQSGKILYSAGHYLAGKPIPVGYDAYGYNYQAHMYSGSYVNVYLGGAGFPPYDGNDATYLAENPTVASHWAWPYRADNVIVKWNDAWLSNQDCDGDGKLDRHYGFPSYIGSGAWETNHQFGVYTDASGKDCKWTYFCKIVAVPADAKLIGGKWINSNGTEIGPVIWGEYATTEEIYNDPCTGDHGVLYKSPAGPGFGKYNP